MVYESRTSAPYSLLPHGGTTFPVKVSIFFAVISVDVARDFSLRNIRSENRCIVEIPSDPKEKHGSISAKSSGSPKSNTTLRSIEVSNFLHGLSNSLRSVSSTDKKELGWTSIIVSDAYRLFPLSRRCTRFERRVRHIPLAAR